MTKPGRLRGNGYARLKGEHAALQQAAVVRD